MATWPIWQSVKKFEALYTLTGTYCIRLMALNGLNVWDLNLKWNLHTILFKPPVDTRHLLAMYMSSLCVPEQSHTITTTSEMASL